MPVIVVRSFGQYYRRLLIGSILYTSLLGRLAISFNIDEFTRWFFCRQYRPRHQLSSLTSGLGFNGRSQYWLD